MRTHSDFLHNSAVIFHKIPCGKNLGRNSAQTHVENGEIHQVHMYVAIYSVFTYTRNILQARSKLY